MDENNNPQDDDISTLHHHHPLLFNPIHNDERSFHEKFEKLYDFWTSQIYPPLEKNRIILYFGLGLSFSLLLYLPWHTFRAIIIHEEDHRPDEVAFNSAAVFVIITLVLSASLIYSHLSNWYMPDVQKYVVRILFMVPIYSVQSWLSLRFQSARIYIDTLRDLYEALVIQSFLYYLMELLGGEECLIQLLQRKDAKYGKHEFIFQYFFPDWTMGMEFARQCKHGVLQYVVVKACTTLATATLQPLNLYGEGQFFNPLVGYPYISFCLNLSQMWALYCLIKFYHATHEELSHPIHWHPLRKFLCIKGVIFFTWWQGIGITYLKSRDIIDTIGNWDKNQVANGIQNYLICSEMFMFALAHMFSFSHLECIPSSYEMRRRSDGRSMSSRRSSRSVPETNATWVSWWYHPWRESFNHTEKDNNEQLTQILLETEIDRIDDNHVDNGNVPLPPPKIKTLEKPGQLYDAFWISTVPRDTLKEVKRFRHDVMSSRKSVENLKT